MSEETTRPEDEVEAHGPIVGEGPEMEATDDEPDVEAHGPVGYGPLGATPAIENPTVE
jgi:hypothetical protein